MKVNWSEAVKTDAKGFSCCLDGTCIEIICGPLCILFFTASGENERVTVSDIETWMSKTPHLMNLFDTVLSSVFQFNSVRRFSNIL